MGTENEDAFISMGKSLDSARAVALAEYASLKDDAEKVDYSDFVTANVIQFLRDNAEKRKDEWSETKSSLLANKFPLCPPGFVEENGICVPIQ